MTQRIAYIPQTALPDTTAEYDCYALADADISTLIPEYDDRDIVEDNPDLLQIISVAALISYDGEQVLVVEKRKDKASIEADKALLWIGGHTDEEDCYGTDTLIDTVANALSRELYEEIGYSISADDILEYGEPIAIRCSYPEKSRKHLAVCFIIECDLEEAISGFNDSELKNAAIMYWGDVPYDKLEAWGKAIYDYLV